MFQMTSVVWTNGLLAVNVVCILALAWMVLRQGQAVAVAHRSAHEWREYALRLKRVAQDTQRTRVAPEYHAPVAGRIR